MKPFTMSIIWGAIALVALLAGWGSFAFFSAITIANVWAAADALKAKDS